MGFKDYEKYETGTPKEEFIKGIAPLAAGTQRIYQIDLDKFLAFNDSSHQELYDWSKGLEASDDPRDRRQLTVAFNDFAKKLENDGLGPSTISGYRKAIHKFLETNELTIRIKKNNQKITHHGSKIVKREQVRKLVDLASNNLRLRAILMTLKDTGLGVAEIVLLTIDDFLGARNYKDEDGKIFKAWAKPLIRKKTGEGCHVHMGPDAVTAIEDYIGQRKTGPIFIMTKGAPHKDKNGKSSPEFGYTNIGDPMKSITVSKTIIHNSKVLRNKGYKITAHSFRKLFETSFDLEGLLNVAKKVMGKAIPSTDEPYLQYEDELTKVYISIYNKRLALYTESTKIKELEETNKMLIEKMAQMETTQKNIMKDIVAEAVEKVTRQLSEKSHWEQKRKSPD